MEQDDTLLSRVKNALASNKNVLGLVASYLLMLLCLVLFFSVNLWIAKLLLALIAIGAALFSRFLLEALRITRKYEKEKQLPPMPAPEQEDPSAEPEQKEEMPKQEDAPEDTDTDNAPNLAPNRPIVFVSEKGNKYHQDKACAGLRFADEVQEISEEEAIALGRQACLRCQQKQEDA
jgi:hypothetical protein